VCGGLLVEPAFVSLVFSRQSLVVGNRSSHEIHDCQGPEHQVSATEDLRPKIAFPRAIK